MMKKIIPAFCFLQFFLLSACAFFGVPGEYHAWFSRQVELAPVRAFETPNGSNEMNDVKAVFKDTAGQVQSEVVFPEYEWGYTYLIQVREKKVVRDKRYADVANRYSLLETEKVLKKLPVAKDYCVVIYLSPLDLPFKREQLADLFRPNKIRLLPAAEEQLLKFTSGKKYRLNVCFRSVPDMTIDVESILSVPDEHSPVK